MLRKRGVTQRSSLKWYQTKQVLYLILLLACMGGLLFLIRYKGQDQQVTQRAETGEGTAYEFYELLPKQQVTPIPSQQQAVDKPQPAVESPQKSGNYILRVNSFTDNRIADELYAQIRILGLNVHVDVETHDQQVWYRVVVGPFITHQQARDAQVLLQQNKIISIMVFEPEKQDTLEDIIEAAQSENMVEAHNKKPQ